MGRRRHLAEPRRLGLARRRPEQARRREPRRRARGGARLLPWDDLAGRAWRLEDARTDEVYERSGDDLRTGLFVALDPFGWHLFDLQPVGG